LAERQVSNCFLKKSKRIILFGEGKLGQKQKRRVLTIYFWTLLAALCLFIVIPKPADISLAQGSPPGVKVNVVAYGKDETDGSGVGWNSFYPNPSFDDDPARRGMPNARWQAAHYWQGDRLCLAIRNLEAPYPPAHTLAIGYTVTLQGGTFDDGSVNKTFVMYRYSGVPGQKNITGCYRVTTAAVTPTPPSQDTNRLNAIAQAYRDILGREPDAAGLNSYYSSGLSIEAIKQSLLNSSECRQARGGECAHRYGQVAVLQTPYSKPPQPQGELGKLPLSGDIEWYRYQGEISDHNEACGPACVAMAIQYVGKGVVSIKEILKVIGKTEEKITNREDLENALKHWGVNFQRIMSEAPRQCPKCGVIFSKEIFPRSVDPGADLGKCPRCGAVFSLEGVPAILEAVRRGHIVIAPVAMNKFTLGPDRDGKSTDPNLNKNKYRSYDGGHFFVVKGISSDQQWIIVNDPLVFGDNKNGNYWYANREQKGKNRFYSIKEFESALQKGASLKILPSTATTPQIPAATPPSTTVSHLSSAAIDAYNRAGGSPVFGESLSLNYTTPNGVASTNTPYKAVELSRGGIYDFSRGVFVVYGAIYQKYRTIGGPRHLLGLPTSNEQEGGKSPFGTTGRVSLFERGSIVWLREKNQAFLVQGAIFNKWASLGSAGVNLGFPISDEYPYQGAARSDFEGGYITWNAQTGAQVSMKAEAQKPLAAPPSQSPSARVSQPSFTRQSPFPPAQPSQSTSAATPLPSAQQPAPTVTEGTLIRLRGQPQVYVIQGGKKCLIPDPETFNANGYKLDQVKEIGENAFNKIPLGTSLTSKKGNLKNFGDPIGEYKGVMAKSRGECTGNPTEACTNNYTHQCVEYVKSFYKDFPDIKIEWGSAKAFWNRGKYQGLARFLNGKTHIKPEADDIIFFEVGKDGHVAIITSVSSSEVGVIQQNWDRNTAFGRVSIKRNLDGSYYLGPQTFSSERGSAAVLGWIRPVSKTSNGLLIKSEGDSKVYVIEDRKKRWISTQEIFRERGYLWEDVAEVSRGTVNLIPDGDPITIIVTF